jgi:fatty acid desaturase
MSVQPSPIVEVDNRSGATGDTASFRRTDDPAQKGARADVKAMRAFLVSAGIQEQFRALELPRTALSVTYLTCAWLGVLGGWYAVVHLSLWALAPALVVFAVAQRSLGNTLHDASHNNVFRMKRSELVAELLLASPMFESFRRYRQLHLQHHAHLGNPASDPDYIELVVKPPRACSRGRAYALAALNFARMALRPKIFVGNLTGDLVGMTWRMRFRVFVWWSAFLALFSLAFGPRDAGSFFALWLLSRATVYHCIKVFTELTDHVGLTPGSILGYTRNAPMNALTFLFHACNDNYHIVHHMAPRVPMANLHKAHDMLLAFDLYAQAEQCDGYFFGENPVVTSWIAPRIGRME